MKKALSILDQKIGMEGAKTDTLYEAKYEKTQ